jgi:hypothetical protein
MSWRRSRVLLLEGYGRRVHANLGSRIIPLRRLDCLCISRLYFDGVDNSF